MVSPRQHCVGRAGTLSVAVTAGADDTDTLYPCEHDRHHCSVMRLSCLQRRKARRRRRGRRLWQPQTWRTLWKPCRCCRCAQFLICTCLPGPACDTASARPPLLIRLSTQLHWHSRTCLTSCPTMIAGAGESVRSPGQCQCACCSAPICHTCTCSG